MKTGPMSRSLLAIFIFLLVLLNVNAVDSAQTQTDFNGEWIGKGSDWSFVLNLKQEGGNILGNYCGVALGGDRIDCNPESSGTYAVHGTSKSNGAEITFRTYYGEHMGAPNSNIGRAILTLRNGKEMKWICVAGPENGWFFMPETMILKKQRQK